MSRDEHGMPLPCDDSPLPWPEMHGVVEDCDGFEICQAGENSSFIAHAANFITPCREIVRRLAEATTKEVSPAESYRKIGYEATKLWLKMQGSGDDT